MNDNLDTLIKSIYSKFYTNIFNLLQLYTKKNKLIMYSHS
jgi:hypothetical protein